MEEEKPDLLDLDNQVHQAETKPEVPPNFGSHFLSQQPEPQPEFESQLSAGIGDIIDQKFECQTCGQVFFGAWNYGKHLNTGHKHKCSQCNQFFSNKKALEKHQKIHVETVIEVEVDEDDPEVEICLFEMNHSSRFYQFFTYCNSRIF